MATKHSVEHEGFRFTRTSAGRVYSHAILVRGSLAADRARCERQARESWTMNLDYYRSKADGTNSLIAKYPEQFPPSRIAAEAAEAKAYLAAGEEGLVAAQLARFDERAAGQKLAADGDTYFVCRGWASRLDLAMKAASAAHGFVVEAVRS